MNNRYGVRTADRVSTLSLPVSITAIVHFISSDQTISPFAPRKRNEWSALPKAKQIRCRLTATQYILRVPRVSVVSSSTHGPIRSWPGTASCDWLATPLVCCFGWAWFHGAGFQIQRVPWYGPTGWFVLDVIETSVGPLIICFDGEICEILEGLSAALVLDRQMALVLDRQMDGLGCGSGSLGLSRVVKHISIMWPFLRFVWILNYLSA